MPQRRLQCIASHLAVDRNATAGAAAAPPGAAHGAESRQALKALQASSTEPVRATVNADGMCEAEFYQCDGVAVIFLPSASFQMGSEDGACSCQRERERHLHRRADHERDLQRWLHAES